MKWKKILEKYNYTSPISILNDFNHHIKEIGGLAEIDKAVEVTRYRKKQKTVTRKPSCDFICSHTCRRYRANSL